MIRVLGLDKRLGIWESGTWKTMRKKSLKKLKIKSSFSRRKGSRRGLHQFDKPALPYIAKATVRWKWNFKKYPAEISNLIHRYDLGSDTRGGVELTFATSCRSRILPKYPFVE